LGKEPDQHENGRAVVAGIEAWLVDFRPDKTDLLQAASPVSKRHFVFVRVATREGLQGTGFASTVGTSGRAVLELLRSDLVDSIVGKSAHRAEAIWDELFWATHGTARGAITGLAMSAIDIALWDLKGKALGVPLWAMAGGYRHQIPVYSAESGWLELEIDQLVQGALNSVSAGWRGIKVKVGKPSPHEDRERVEAVREAIGSGIDLMIDSNQSLTSTEAIRLASLLEPFDIYWFEEPLPADDVCGHRLLASSTSIPIAFGESLYTLSQFREYLAAGIRGIVQPDATRVGGITPWLKIAHLAEAFNTKVAPHVRTELSASLAGAVPNGLYIEQHSVLQSITKSRLEIVDGLATVPLSPGVGIEWDDEAIDEMRVS
jgi:L-alanine-DL-glutamate epimerase-like enolase superfamily enzyme